MVNKNQIVEITIEDVGINGEGIGKVDGFPLFVKDAVIGDRIRALVMKTQKSYGYARIEEILEPGSGRTKPLCPVAGKCGGCQLQSYSYEAQLQVKSNKVRNNLQRIGGLSPETLDQIMEPIIGMDNPYHYRNKAQYPLGVDRDGRTISGFYAAHSHRIVPSENCMLNVEGCEEILDIVKDYMTEQKIKPYDEVSGKGLVRHVLIRKGFASGEWMVCLIINSHRSSSLVNVNRLIDKLAGIPGMTAISCCFNTRKDNVIMGDSYKTLWGSPVIRDTLGGVEFEISPLSFYQVNPVQTEKLYGKALEYALASTPGKQCEVEISGRAVELHNSDKFNKDHETVNFDVMHDKDRTCESHVSNNTTDELCESLKEGELSDLETHEVKKNKIIWDLYCGIGTISLFLAKAAPDAQVYGVEIIPQAIDDARNNALRNGIGNAEFYVGKAEEVLPKHYERTGTGADVIVVDPPRKGCDPKVLDTMFKMAPERIVYVSCDSATLARDIKILSEGMEVNGGRISYMPVRVCPCDMFGMTAHVETVCLLSKLHEAKHHVSVKLDMDEMDITSAESKATYEEIKKYVAEHNGGMKVSNLYIAQVKSKYEIIERDNFNKPKSEKAKQPLCPKEKENAIVEALKAFKMI